MRNFWTRFDSSIHQNGLSQKFKFVRYFMQIFCAINQLFLFFEPSNILFLMQGSV